MRCQVSFIADNMEFDWCYVQRLQQVGVEVLYSPHVHSVWEHLAAQGCPYDLIVLSRHYIAIKYVDAIRRLAPKTKILFDTVDLHYLRLNRQAELDGNRQVRRLAKAAYRDEIYTIRTCDLTLVVSGAEKALLAQEAPQAQVMVLSNVHDPVPWVAPLSGRRDILFVGGFQHPPNLDAIKWYGHEIWPQVKRELPEARTLVIGSKMPEEFRRMGEALGLDMVGYVPDLDPYLNGCRLSISPLRFGAGVKGKVNQSMSYGLPVVATSPSIEGMGLEPGRDILVADDADSFATSLVRLYRDDPLWERLSQGGLANVEERFSSRVARQALEEIFKRLGLWV
jgi:glycosyltransferase involved in cell wall biosynthesis